MRACGTARCRATLNVEEVTCLNARTLKSAIKQLGVSQAEVARRVGVRECHVTDMIKGRRRITPTIERAVSRMLVLEENDGHGNS